MSDEYLNPRRQFLTKSAFGLLAGTSFYLLGCTKPKGPPSSTMPQPDANMVNSPASTPTSIAASEPVIAEPTMQCVETEDNIEGPYYRPGAPQRSVFIDSSTPGTKLLLRGQVWGMGCKAPLAGALLDFWQATYDGHYDIDGTMSRADVKNFIFRGKQTADEQGKFSLTTVIPGNYLNGAQYRPAHIHVKVSSPGHETLTTQLYFDGDPYNDIDPFIHRSLIMPLQSDASTKGKKARFDFVLIPA
jgi:protocatechuate 3,4-dioxygenase beta subunit